MVFLHRLKAFFDGLLQVLVDIHFGVIAHEICGGTKVENRFVVFGDHLRLGIVAHPFYAFYVAVQLAAHDDGIGLGEDFGFFGAGEADRK